MQINNLIVTNNNSSKAKGGTRCQKPTIRVKRDGVLIARVEVDPDKRASDPLGYLRRLYMVDEHAAAKRQELIDALKRAEVPQCDIDSILKV